MYDNSFMMMTRAQFQGNRGAAVSTWTQALGRIPQAMQLPVGTRLHGIDGPSRLPVVAAPGDAYRSAESVSAVGRDAGHALVRFGCAPVPLWDKLALKPIEGELCRAASDVAALFTISNLVSRCPDREFGALPMPPHVEIYAGSSRRVNCARGEEPLLLHSHPNVSTALPSFADLQLLSQHVNGTGSAESWILSYHPGIGIELSHQLYWSGVCGEKYFEVSHWLDASRPMDDGTQRSTLWARKFRVSIAQPQRSVGFGFGASIDFRQALKGGPTAPQTFEQQLQHATWHELRETSDAFEDAPQRREWTYPELWLDIDHTLGIRQAVMRWVGDDERAAQLTGAVEPGSNIPWPDARDVLSSRQVRQRQQLIGRQVRLLED